MGHPDPVILDCDGAGGVVGGDVHFQGKGVVVDGVPRQLEMTQLFEGVTGIGDEFPDEDFPVGVEGMNDDIQQLPDFGLEGVCFRR